MADSILNACNLDAIEWAYERWRHDPAAVDASWKRLFTELGFTDVTGATGSAGLAGNIIRLVDAYRALGHLLAHLDPLNDQQRSLPLLEPSEFGFSDQDLDAKFETSHFLGVSDATLRDLIDALRQTYCRTIGVEYLHIGDPRVRRWLQERMEPIRNQPSYTRERRIRILRQLHSAEHFERFLHTTYVGQKRFSLEGAETLIPLLDAVVERAADHGVREIVFGMPHRGRLNVLDNILEKPFAEIFSEFEENFEPLATGGAGDVRYHIGFSSDRTSAHGNGIHLSLSPNPSHLEAVDPVVEGRTRAKQDRFGDAEGRLGMPVLIHGDAAFAGQGVVAETLNLSQLKGFKTGGTVHIIVNNQNGFTTAPAAGRSTVYCTDIAKMLDVPIFHVNAEDPEASVFVAELAFDFRQSFHQDVFIDLICYRRHGHNEGDEPSFTQPRMYAQIKERPSFSAIYSDRLLQAGVLTQADIADIDKELDQSFAAARTEIQSGARPSSNRPFAEIGRASCRERV